MSVESILATAARHGRVRIERSGALLPRGSRPADWRGALVISLDG